MFSENSKLNTDLSKLKRDSSLRGANWLIMLDGYLSIYLKFNMLMGEVEQSSITSFGNTFFVLM